MDQGLRAKLDSLFRTGPLLSLLGIELVDWEPGAAELRLVTRSEQANLAGCVHGGVLFALADAAFEVACNSHGRVCVALETTCHYQAPAAPGCVLVARASEISRSRRTGSYRIEVTGSDDGATRYSSYMALCYRTERWHLGGELWPQEWQSSH